MWACILALAPALACASAAGEPRLTVVGTAFRLQLADGRVLQGVELEGATLQLALASARITPVRLEAIRADPDDPQILRHQFMTRAAGGAWQPLCAPDARGQSWGFPLALPEGHPGREGDITLSCASGAVGKCVRFGYKPWAAGPHGEALLPYHAACVRMVRADYCGDGGAHTRDGTMIEMADDLGIQAWPIPRHANFDFEAAYGPGGAVCVARPRWPGLLSLEQLHARCPRLSQPGACTEASARARGALLFNRSSREPRAGD